MNDFKVYSGPVGLIATGTAIAYMGNPIEIQFGLSPSDSQNVPQEAPWSLTFEFIDEKGIINNERIEAHAKSYASLVLKLYNFTNLLGSGTEQPLEIGQHRGKTVWLHFRVYQLANSDKTLQFSIYRARPAAPTGVYIS